MQTSLLASDPSKTRSGRSPMACHGQGPLQPLEMKICEICTGPDAVGRERQLSAKLIQMPDGRGLPKLLHPLGDL